MLIFIRLFFLICLVFYTVGSQKSSSKCSEYGKAVYEHTPQKFDTCVQDKTAKVATGIVQAKPREFPHMARLGLENKDADGENVTWPCSGILISDEYVLTAAHCLSNPSYGDRIYVKLGDLDLSTKKDDAADETFNVVETIKHPDFKPSSSYNDIGLLRLDRKVTLNKYIRPVCLPTESNIAGNEAIASGWSNNEPGDSIIDQMRKVVLTIPSNEKCNDTFSSFNNRRLKDGIRDTHICAVSPQHSDFCIGNAGGPLQIYHPTIHCMYTVIGISSFGVGCNNDVPTVHTRVFPYVEWIESIVWQN